MAGQFKSTVICLTCNKKSVVFDPYMLLSLSIPKPKLWEFYYLPSNYLESTTLYEFQMSAKSTVKDLKT